MTARAALAFLLVAIGLAGCERSNAAPEEHAPATAKQRDLLLIWDPTSSRIADRATVEAALKTLEVAVIDRLAMGGRLHIFTVDASALHKAPVEVQLKRRDDELKHGGEERFRARIRKTLTESLAGLVDSWEVAHRATSGEGPQPLESCLLSSLDRAARLSSGQPERRYELILVSDLQEACRDWGGERGINLEAGGDQLAAFAGLDWWTDLSRVDQVTVLLLPPAHGLERGQEQRALQQAWRKHLAAAGVPVDAIVFR